MKKLNIGCGNQILNGYDNYDKYPVNDNVKYLDLEQFPYKIKSNYADEILLSHVLEHLTTNKLDVIKELHRILKPNGLLIIKLPSNLDLIDHEKGSFEYTYLEGLYKNQVKNPKYKKQMFNLIDLVKNKRTFLNTIFKFRVWIDKFFYREYIWILKKI